MNYHLYKTTFSKKITIPNQIVDEIVEYRVLSKKEMIDLYNNYGSDKQLYIIKVVEASLLKPHKYLIDLLSDEIINQIFEEIFKASNILPDKLELFEKLFWLQNSDELKSDTWSCDICKEKGLQRARGCRYLPENEIEETSIVIRGELYKFCPIYDIMENAELISSAYQSYSLLDKGLLPESGGFYDQTSFFCEFSMLTQRLLRIKEAEEIEKMKKE